MEWRGAHLAGLGPRPSTGQSARQGRSLAGMQLDEDGIELRRSMNELTRPQIRPPAKPLPRWRSSRMARRGSAAASEVTVHGVVSSSAPDSLLRSFPSTAAGDAGLGRGSLSLPSQLYSKLPLTKRQFAICLPSTAAAPGVAFFGEPLRPGELLRPGVGLGPWERAWSLPCRRSRPLSPGVDDEEGWRGPRSLLSPSPRAAVLDGGVHEGTGERRERMGLDRSREGQLDGKG